MRGEGDADLRTLALLAREFRLSAQAFGALAHGAQPVSLFEFLRARAVVRKQEFHLAVRDFQFKQKRRGIAVADAVVQPLFQR